MVAAGQSASRRFLPWDTRSKRKHFIPVASDPPVGGSAVGCSLPPPSFSQVSTHLFELLFLQHESRGIDRTHQLYSRLPRNHLEAGPRLIGRPILFCVLFCEAWRHAIQFGVSSQFCIKFVDAIGSFCHKTSVSLPSMPHPHPVVKHQPTALPFGFFGISCG